MLLPFGLLLAAIALAPLCFGNWWSKHYSKVALGIAAVPLGYYFFALRAPEAEWAKFWSQRPPPGSNDLMALIRRKVLKAEGDLQVFMAHLRYFKEALAKLRGIGVAA